MDWIKPKFSQETSHQPRKKPRLDSVLPKSGSHSTFNNAKSITSSKSVSWVEKYTPLSKHELIVNKKKIEEVESWLFSLGEGGSRILLLTGAPGSGKLTTLKVLCRDLRIQVSEWITPSPQEYDPENYNSSYCSQQRSFEEFIIRASRYTSVLSSSTARRIVVVKDIPNVFLRDPLIFHEFMQKFNDCDGISIAFIITENSLILELFPESLKNLLNIKIINFNPITKKALTTVLTNIIKKEKFGSSLESNLISEISETCDGDLRNAIMSLNFVSKKGSGAKRQISERKSRSKAHAGKDGPLKHLLTDPSIDLFHGLGRVLYTKRNENGQLTHNPNNIVDSFTSCTNTFINMLQENYLNIYSDISISQAANYLSLSDFILNDMNDTMISREIALSVAVRGIMHTNRAPIKKFQQFSKTKNTKAMDLSKSYSDCIKANFCCSNPNSILLDSVTYLNKMSKNLETESQRNIVKELSRFYLMDKNCCL